ncbi:glycosyltransferase family 4 protein [Candidatus Uabimicrobium amorphum]|uniref:Glycosyl transferase n=1 Tax=Uabimicrobium amorphum TaxID=2596890 RepID=A0A5S9IHI8_UABAM|nr:glycosyltransferase family 4 protein [Candidatus Uabimicrobium amorphum]BBM81918.1 glycosyl transferase [Candidatus Uabimicrobium amorphum]
MVKVCFISHSSQKWGAEKFLLETVLQLRDQIEIVVLLPNNGALCEDLQKYDIDHHIIPYTWWVGKNISIIKGVVKLVHSLFVGMYIAYKLKKMKCDVVFSNTCTICVGAIAAQVLRIKHVWFTHEFLWEDHQLRFHLGKNISTFLMDKLSHHCVVNSYAVYESFTKNLSRREKWRVMYQPVTLHFSPKPISIVAKKNFRCMILGAIKDNKGQKDAIAAVYLLKEKYSICAELFIIGDGKSEYVNELKKQVCEHDMQEQIIFIPYVEFAASWMNETDIVLVCSKNEAYGRVTVEAFLSKKSVVGSASGGTCELLKDDNNGLLYEPGNIEQLAKKIKILHDSETLRNEIAERAYLWAEDNISWQKYNKELCEILSVQSE